MTESHIQVFCFSDFPGNLEHASHDITEDLAAFAPNRVSPTHSSQQAENAFIS